MIDSELMQIQASTLYILNEESRIIRVNERDQTTGPALFIGRTRDGILSYFHHDLPASLVEEIKALTLSSVNIISLYRILERAARVKDMWIGPAYRFNPDHMRRTESHVILIDAGNEHVLLQHFGHLVKELADRSPMAGYIVDGRAVSVCCVARKSDKAAEASLVTIPQFRGKGLAQQVVSAWSREVSVQGLIPLYSTSWDNLNSQKVAYKLGLVQYGMDISIWLCENGDEAGTWSAT